MPEIMCPFVTEAGGWQLKPFGSEAEGRRALELLLIAMAGMGYSERARARVRSAVQPALASALRCGRLAAPGGVSAIRYRAGEDFTLAEVEGWVPGPAGPPLRGPHRVFGRPDPDLEPFRVRSYTRVRCDRGDGRVIVWGSLSAR
jgi:hypothetical protein